MSFEVKSYIEYTFSGTGDGSPGDPFVGTFTIASPLFSSDVENTFSESGIGGSVADEFEIGETLTSTTLGNVPYLGYVDLGGIQYILIESQFGQYILLSDTEDLSSPTDTASYPASFTAGGVSPDLNLMNLMVCFGEGTQISTPGGHTEVQSLQIGDLVTTENGGTTPVKWIGRQAYWSAIAVSRMEPVRIRAGALGIGLPHKDLIVTADHGMVVDGLVINASAMVNGSSIDFVPNSELPHRVTYYHIETEKHDVILANGAAAETFLDAATRARFDNYQEYLDLYGAERIIPEMKRPRITSQRLLPETIKQRLGIVDEVTASTESLIA